MDRIQLQFGDDTTGPTWVVTYYLGESDIDDSLDDESKVEVELSAANFETAVRYAQQYLKKKTLEDDSWSSAEILSVELY